MMTLPLREAVALICADLYVTPDWSLWTEAPPQPPPGGGGGGPRRGGGGACALRPAEAPQRFQAQDAAGDDRAGADPATGPPPDPLVRAAGIEPA